VRLSLCSSGVWLGTFFIVATVGCQRSPVSSASIDTEIVEVRVDDATIAAGRPLAVIDPVWWTANIYDGPAAYEQSLQPFSKAQRLVHAMLWYQEEVNNGGHEQFYSNSTGIVWQDALEGFEAAALPQVAAVLRESANRLGGSPSLVREDRQKQLASLSPHFDDLDDKFYELEKRVDVEGKIMEFIRSRLKDFYFSGRVEKPVRAR